MKILLPVDGSADALAAVRHALALVRDGLQADFVLANVQEPASLYEMVVAHDPDVIVHVRSDAGADLLLPAEALLEAAGLSYESEVAGGQPATVLVDLLENYGCDAVVMGARGAGSGSASVATALLQRSPVPVTLVRAVETEEPPPEPGPPEG
ncbi:MAG TPA: universal stress protein [Rubrivivax sp.]|nr:universal stress protein [Rubrivivax sp.]